MTPHVPIVVVSKRAWSIGSSPVQPTWPCGTPYSGTHPLPFRSFVRTRAGFSRMQGVRVSCLLRGEGPGVSDEDAANQTKPNNINNNKINNNSKRLIQDNRN